jgi:hypothetical protein
MAEWVLSYGIKFGVLTLEVALLVIALRQWPWRPGGGLCAYIGCLLAAEVARPAVRYIYGYTSLQFAYFYWLTDVALALGAFVLICIFFHRACTHEPRMWCFLRVLLVFVFFLVLGISSLTLFRNYSQIYTHFIIEFEQNLYFTCLVLNTLLYILLQQIESTDDQLGLLVCGLGIQFAGPAASFALVHLRLGQHYSNSLLLRLIMPLGTLAMLLTWFYATARVPKTQVAGAEKSGSGSSGKIKMVTAKGQVATSKA